jgi:hypothetical protein
MTEPLERFVVRDLHNHGTRKVFRGAPIHSKDDCVGVAPSNPLPAAKTQ